MFIQAFEWAYASPAIEGDIFACLAVSWFLFAITVDQSAVRSAFIHWSAHGFTTFFSVLAHMARDSRIMKEIPRTRARGVFP